MTRRCKCGCDRAIPTAAASTTIYHKKKFYSFSCMEEFGLEALKKEREKLRQGLDCYVQRVTKKKAAEKKKEAGRKKRDYYDNDVSKQLKLTQISFNRMIKLERYKELLDDCKAPSCISCSKIADHYALGEFACGHLKTVGAHEELRFNTLNTELQCNRYCNKGLSGNITGNKNSRGYLEGLKRRRGIEEYEKRMSYLERKQPNFTRDAKQLKIVRRWCDARWKKLKEELHLD